MKKKILVRICALIAAISLLGMVPVKAAQPRYIALTTATCSLQISDSGCATCYTYAYVVEETYTVEISMTLQRAAMTGEDWTAVRNVPWTTTGNCIVSLQQLRFVTSGYYYRVYSVISIYDTDGSLIEAQPVYSQVVEY